MYTQKKQVKAASLETAGAEIRTSEDGMCGRMEGRERQGKGKKRVKLSYGDNREK